MQTKREPTPIFDDTESQFEGSQISDAQSELSSLSSEPEESDFSGSEQSVLIRRAGRKSNGNTKGRGVRLDGGLLDDYALDLANMTEEDKVMTIAKMKERRREERRAWTLARAPLTKQQHALRKELGRKLTNGEKNFIALSYVGPSFLAIVVISECFHGPG